MTRLDAAQWSAYWQSGATTTFQDSFSGNYDREVGQFWQGVFRTLPTGSRMVDLACGNGALALLAADFRRATNSHFDIDAVDFAQIQLPSDSEARALAKDVHFYSGRRLEDSGLESSAYQLAVSQFGIEYGQRETTISELSRILADADAQLAMICHREDSAIVQQGKDGLQQQKLCAASPLPDLVRRLQKRMDQLQREGRDPAKDRACERLRERFNRSMAELHTAAEQRENPDHLLYFIRGCLAAFDANNMQRLSLPQRLTMVDRLEGSCAAFAARMRDLVSAALSEQELQAWLADLTAHGFQIRSNAPFTLENRLFGQQVICAR